VNGLLLDTHAWVWYAEGIAGRFSEDNLGKIEEAREQARLYVSTISVWEIGMLHGKRRITLSATLDAWIERAFRLPGLRPLPLDAASALESTRLPGVIHGDPADRFLVAVSRTMGLHLMTIDEKIIEYARQGYVNVIPIGGPE
jgi:PIN domain nuclease of toxin-antitoxin system